MAVASIAHAHVPLRVTVGVDTHKETHVGHAKDELGRDLGHLEVPTTMRGYAALLAWANSHGEVVAFGVEGTSSYGMGLSRYLQREGLLVLEVLRPGRQERRFRGKSDPIDAEAAAAAVLSGKARHLPRASAQRVEMIRALRITRTSAIKARTQAINAIKALVVMAPDELREALRGLPTVRLISACAHFRPGQVIDPTAVTKTALRSLASRCLALEAEARELEIQLDQLTSEAAPALCSCFGVGSDSAAALLIAAGDNPGRLRSDSSFSMLCGSSPIPASSGQTKRHRLNRGGDRQANAALHRIVMTRLRWQEPTKTYMQRRLAEGKSKPDIIRCLKRYVAREIFNVLAAAARPS